LIAQNSPGIATCR